MVPLLMNLTLLISTTIWNKPEMTRSIQNDQTNVPNDRDSGKSYCAVCAKHLESTNRKQRVNRTKPEDEVTLSRAKGRLVQTSK